MRLPFICLAIPAILVELFLFTMHQLAFSAELPCDARPPGRVFLAEWLRRRRAESNALLPDNLLFTPFERQQLVLGLEECCGIEIPNGEIADFHTVLDVQAYLQRQQTSLAA